MIESGKKGKFIDIQNKVIEESGVVVCKECIKGYRTRTHAHIKEKTICKWNQRNSFDSTFVLFHEIGHIMTTTTKMRRCEEEYFATSWAIDKCKKMGLEINQQTINRYQEYINREKARGIRRGGKGYYIDLELKY